MKPTRKLKVFIIDDDKTILKSVEHQLTSNSPDSYEIATFSTGEPALEQINENEYPDICILDYYLNSDNADAMDGLSVLQKLKEQNDEIEVVMLSGETDEEVAKNTFNFGAFDYITKGGDARYRMKLAMKNLTTKIGYREYHNAQNAQSEKMFKRLLFIIIGICVLSAIVVYINTLE